MTPSMTVSRRPPRATTSGSCEVAAASSTLVGMTGQEPSPSDRQVPASDDFSLALGRAVASRLLADPDGVRTIGRRNLVRAVEQHGPTAQHWIARWRALLDGPDDDLIAVLTSPDEWARVLRQTSPFAGVLTPRERWALLDEVRMARRAS
ncbi:hypothetical protein BH23ACT10_BH23ACT10_33340 [soil metagenome]